MFEIVGREEQVFEQWEQGAKVSNPCMKAGDEAVFRNASGATAVMIAREESGQVVCDVPNKLLQMCCNILVDLEQGNDRHTECRTTFTVNPAQKPDGYKCVDNSVPDTRISFNDLKDKPFYSEVVESVDVEVKEQTITAVTNSSGKHTAKIYKTHTGLGTIKDNTHVIVVFDGELFDLRSNNNLLGNKAAAGIAGAVDTGEPFYIATGTTITNIYTKTPGDHTIAITVYKEETVYHPIDPKFLPVDYLKQLIAEVTGK